MDKYNINITVCPFPHGIIKKSVCEENPCGRIERRSNMCTAITYKTKDHYYGRNLDLEYSFDLGVTITPRNHPFNFRKVGTMAQHFAIIGIATVKNGFPLYFDATNEKGLSMAGLNFPENAHYLPYCQGKDNVPPFELIPWLLGQCSSVAEVEDLLKNVNILDEDFSPELPLTPVHWLIADSERSITVEAVKDGLKIYDNPVGVLTNNPTFDYHMFNLNNYMQLSNDEPQNTFGGASAALSLKLYSRGMGALGLPGDASSMSRFVKAAFVKLNSLSGTSEAESVSQFFHILQAVAMPRGFVHIGKDLFEITVYTSCCNATRGIYYYTTYENSQICAVDMHKENLEASALIYYPLDKSLKIACQN